MSKKLRCNNCNKIISEDVSIMDYDKCPNCDSTDLGYLLILKDGARGNNANDVGLKISCPFSIRESNNITRIGFKGINQIAIKEPFIFNDIDLFDYKIDKLEIQDLGEGKYNLICIFNYKNKPEDIIVFLDKISYYITYLLLKEERNGHYGTNYIEFDFLNLISSNRGLLRDTVSMCGKREFSFSQMDWDAVKNNELLKYYYDGAKAVDLKSKYFHWFLVIENVEHSPLYKRKFQKNYFFNEEERLKIKKFAKEFKHEGKKSALGSVVSKTAKNRTEKLFEILLDIGLNEYRGTIQKYSLEYETVYNILDIRNNLVHEGKKLDETLFWEHFYPIIKAIVDKSLINNKFLD